MESKAISLAKKYLQDAVNMLEQVVQKLYTEFKFLLLCFCGWFGLIERQWGQERAETPLENTLITNGKTKSQVL